mgnify:CR=1 FL=1
MPTYKAIASTTVGAGGASSITFSSIPGTYTDLVLKISTRDDSAFVTSYLNLQFNGDSGAYYDQKNVSGMLNGTITNQSWPNQNQYYIYQGNAANSTASTFCNTEVYIPNYTSSSNKSISNDGVAESNTSSSNNRAVALCAGLYHPSSNTAITSISLTPASGNFVQYSTATLYGIKNS